MKEEKRTINKQLKELSQEEISKKGISRRSFIKGAAATAAGVATMGILGACADTAASSTTPDTTKASGSVSEGNTPNPSAMDGYLTAETTSQKWIFEVAPDPIPESKIIETHTAEIIVVGAGTAGLVCANSAAENGADVILITASSKPISRGGSNHAFKSRLMEENGLGDVYKGKIGEFFKKEMISSSYDLDQRKWYTFYNNSEESMNWLLDKMEAAGFTPALEDYSQDPGAGENSVIIGAHCFLGKDITAKGMGQSLVVDTLANTAAASGVTITYNMTAEQLVREDNNTGRVTAVIAKNTDGDYIKYEGSKAIVLATGDFSADKDMMTRYCPEALPLLTDRELNYDAEFQFGGLYKGDGHKMGLWVGAAWQKTEHCAPMICMGGSVSNFMGGPLNGLLINKDGIRIGNEDMTNSFACHQLLRQPDMGLYGIWGSNAAADKDAAATWEANGAVKADTIKEVIALLGLPDETIETVNRYNELCQSGEDVDFYKRSELMVPIAEGPFYGGAGTLDFLTVVGGLRTNEVMQVCDEKDEPIPGLYNLGAMVGDFYGNLYTFFTAGCNYGGNCLTFGYLTGRYIVENEY